MVAARTSLTRHPLLWNIHSLFFSNLHLGADALAPPYNPKSHGQSQLKKQMDCPSPINYRLCFSTQPNPLEGMSEERKSNLFQFLLRDLEVEEVPLLGIDATETRVFQAALWTTMGELSENDYADKVCLVFEDISIPTLQLFVNEFDSVKRNDFIMQHLPELQRFNISLVGRGVGPAVVLSTSNRTDDQRQEYHAMKQSTAVPDEIRWTAAMKTFVARTLPSSGLENAAYRFIGSADACDIMSGYWTSICEFLSVPKHEMSLMVVAYPSTMKILKTERHDRYVAISLLINHMAYMCDDSKESISNIHVQPFYDRNAPILHHNMIASLGHLIPTDYASNGDKSLSEEQLTMQNFLRRSPLPGVVIRRRDTEMDSDIALVSQTLKELEDAVTREQEIITPFKE